MAVKMFFFCPVARTDLNTVKAVWLIIGGMTAPPSGDLWARRVLCSSCCVAIELDFNSTMNKFIYLCCILE